MLLRDPLGLLLALPVAALWLIGAVALVVRGLVMDGAARAISYAFAVVAVCGAAAGIVSAVLTQHGVADTVTPTGAFLLAVGGLASVILWARAEDPEPRPVAGDRVHRPSDAPPPRDPHDAVARRPG